MEHTEQRLSFQIGRTALVFEPNLDWDGLYHYAFQTPEHQFDEAVAWLSQWCTLLENSEGQQVFHFDIWNAHAVYFADEDRNIAELIAHHDLETPFTGPFGAGSILGVNEIGLVVDDVPATSSISPRRTGYRLIAICRIRNLRRWATARGDSSS